MHCLFIICMFCFLTTQTEAIPANILAKCRIDNIDNHKIVHMEGSAYEIGYQHGSLLKKEIADNLARFITPVLSPSQNRPPVIAHFMEALPRVVPHVPAELMEEMQGMADASELPFSQILLLNLFPEMFHCSAVTVNGDATSNGELYHVRVLDYSAGNGLQHTAILAVVKPDNGLPFLNFTYAGFVGCVTGMNQEKISIGEIGGKGYGNWDGVPMAFLLRTILQHASTLDQIKQILNTTARTCEYFYIFADGKTGGSFGCQTTSDYLQYFEPGESYSKNPPLLNTFDRPLLTPNINISTNSVVLYKQPKDTLIISRGDHYDLLKERLLKTYGNINLEDLKEAIKEPIAHKANLHNAIFAPETLDVWISHAGALNEPACDQPYHHFNLKTIMGE
ncbi:MAG TPA: C45 family peptidase [Parachlamydiaceae bacterium]|nr:C45 family peptidase [Parachlamydiaceae bacterium]